MTESNTIAEFVGNAKAVFAQVERDLKRVEEETRRVSDSVHERVGRIEVDLKQLERRVEDKTARFDPDRCSREENAVGEIQERLATIEGKAAGVQLSWSRVAVLGGIAGTIAAIAAVVASHYGT